MHSIEIPYNKIKLDFPGNIAECTTSEYIDFARLNYDYSLGEINFQELKVQLLYKLLNLKRKADMSKKSNAVVAENIFRIGELLNSFYKTTRQDGKTFKEVDLSCITNKIRFFNHGDELVYGPTAALANTVFAQYLAANDSFHDYTATRQEEYLDLLVAQLYWPKGKKYDPEAIESRAELMSNVDTGIKYGTYLFYAACQKWMATQNALPIGGGKTVDLTVLFSQKTGETTATPGIGMLGTLYDLAETGVFGDIHATGKQNTYDILVYLVNKHHEAEKLKRDAKNKRP
ncbi:hypothetical protein ACH3O9_11380 [Leeuwenhoekiella sp. A16]|uniref:hypothetical protein n=1 Tax=Leeuwenhoekiella sp. A16 TaxID=3141462 RepID=UPI003A806FBC